MASEWYQMFSDDIIEINIEDLSTSNGDRVKLEWFGSTRKKDSVVVSTLFGILGRAMRRKHPGESKFIGSKEFIAARKHLRKNIAFDQLAGKLDAPVPANSVRLYETPPTTPEQTKSTSKSTNSLSNTDACNMIEELSNSPIGPRLRVKYALAASRSVMETLRNTVTEKASVVGQGLGYSFLYSSKEDQQFVREIISTAISCVGQKLGIKKAFSSILDDDIHTELVSSMRVADWIQLYVKLSTKLPDKSWQTILNFLNIGRSGVSLQFRRKCINKIIVS
jgi:hypothetical protein